MLCALIVYANDRDLAECVPLNLGALIFCVIWFLVDKILKKGEFRVIRFFYVGSGIFFALLMGAHAYLNSNACALACWLAYGILGIPIALPFEEILRNWMRKIHEVRLQKKIDDITERRTQVPADAVHGHRQHAALSTAHSAGSKAEARRIEEVQLLEAEAILAAIEEERTAEV